MFAVSTWHYCMGKLLCTSEWRLLELHNGTCSILDHSTIVKSCSTVVIITGIKCGLSSPESDTGQRPGWRDFTARQRQAAGSQQPHMFLYTTVPSEVSRAVGLIRGSVHSAPAWRFQNCHCSDWRKVWIDWLVLPFVTWLHEWPFSVYILQDCRPCCWVILGFGKCIFPLSFSFLEVNRNQGLWLSCPISVCGLSFSFVFCFAFLAAIEPLFNITSCTLLDEEGISRKDRLTRRVTSGEVLF
jgi:hypothetical protein